jgi:hypothetical protein
LLDQLVYVARSSLLTLKSCLRDLVVAPVLNKLERVEIVIMVEKETMAVGQEVGARVEVDVGIDAFEPRSKVACEGYIGDRNDKTPSLAAISRVRRGMHRVDLRRFSVKRGKKFEIDEFARVEVLQALGKAENGTYTASAITFSKSERVSNPSRSNMKEKN